ncbi:hypothetical protein BJX99DRAFT_221062 [Aspergillus californicus]
MYVNKIQPLPSEVAAKIKSSTSVTHLNGVIVDLVKNSLDADAHSIYVTVDYHRGGCIVEDDGFGILPAEFGPDGGLGKSHHTSKAHSKSPVHGRKGCFLTSLSSLALLTVTSHHVHHASTNTVMFHHSSPVARLIPAPRHHGLKFTDHGTRVTVNDLFGNMPVRVKNRALTLQKTDELDRQWDDLKHQLISVMISNNRLLKLVISDVEKERKLTIRPRRSFDDNEAIDLTRVASILSQAGLTETQDTRLWHVVSATVPNLAIHAALSLVPSPSKKAQFVSLGIDPLLAQNQANVLFNEVNRLFAMSDFGTTGDLFTAHNTPADIDGQALAKPMQKAVNKWPMFYIRIESGDAAITTDNQELPESDKSLQQILDVLTLMINEYLKQHRMRPRGAKRSRQTSVTQDEESQADRGARIYASRPAPSAEFPGKRLKIPAFSRPDASHFRNWSRIKSGNSHSNGTMSLEKATPFRVPASVSAPGGSTAPTSMDNPTLDITAGQAIAADIQDENQQPGSDAMIPWIDPHTGIRHWINSRTGQSVNVRPSAASVLANRPKSTGSLNPTRALDSTKRPASAPQQNLWLDNVLENWKNPVFRRSERLIDALETDLDCVDPPGQHFHGHYGLDSFGVSRYRGKLRKQDLAAARVIGQVDRKFVLVELLSHNTSTVALIDQHAADERCRVETLYEEFLGGPHGVQTMQVDPVIFYIPATEAFMFKRQAEFFKAWGIQYVIEHDTQSTKASVSISQLPALIAERCRTEPDLLVNIIRGEIWKRTESGGLRSQTLVTGKSKHSEDWVSRLAGCPQGILDLLNSRACRTAIMFNDALDIYECQSLVRRLATCVFPFQCAHGRPSMVPLVDLRGGLDQHNLDGEYTDLDEKGSGGFLDAFKRWQPG